MIPVKHVQRGVHFPILGQALFRFPPHPGPASCIPLALNTEVLKAQGLVGNVIP